MRDFATEIVALLPAFEPSALPELKQAIADVVFDIQESAFYEGYDQGILDAQTQ